MMFKSYPLKIISIVYSNRSYRTIDNPKRKYIAILSVNLLKV